MFFCKSRKKDTGKSAETEKTPVSRTEAPGGRAGNADSGVRRTRIALAVVSALLSVSLLLGAYYTFYRPVPVLVATRDIRPGETVQPRDLTVKKVALADKAPTALSSPAEVQGKKALTPIYQGSQVLKQQVLEPSSLIREGMTMVVVKNPSCPELSTGQRVVACAAMPEGPLVIGEATVVSSFRPDQSSQDTFYVLAVHEDVAPRLAYATVKSNNLFLFPRY